MPSLPDRPDLEQLRRLAKELRDAANRGEVEALARVAHEVGGSAGAPVTLAAAQLTLAREHGFGSWPAMKASVDASAGRHPPALDDFLTASIEGDQRLARQLLEESPHLPGEPLAAVVLGEADRVARVIAGAQTWTTALDERRGWPPLLYACYSHWPRFEPQRADALLATVRLLLDAGADARTHNGMLDGKARSALHGSAITDQDAITRLLLQKGASAHERAVLRDAASNGSFNSLVALLDYGATVRRTWAVGAAAYSGHTKCLRALLEALSAREGPGNAAAEAGEALEGLGPDASTEVVRVLLEFGADPDGPGHERPPLRAAVRSGRHDIAELLARAGATSTVTPVDELIGVCARADRSAVERMVLDDPGLVGQFTDEDRAAIVELAASASTEPVRLLLGLGLPVTARNGSGETALHNAAYQGRTATVTLLLGRGADVEAVDDHFSATPLAFATVGSGERPNSDGDWPGTVRALLGAGASTIDAWVAEKPPSPEVAELLRAYGVGTPTAEGPSSGPTGAAADGDQEWPGGELGQVAGALRDAYAQTDMQLFASVLHPDVQFGSGPMACEGRDEVVARFGAMVAQGFHGEITRCEALPGALVAEVRFSGTPRGTTSPGPQLAYQRFDIENGLVVHISGHEGMAAASNRPAIGQK